MKLLGEPEALVAALARALAGRSVDLACAPYVLAFWQHIKGEPVTIRASSDDIVKWGRLYNLILKEVAPDLYRLAGADEAAEARFVAALLFALEAGVREELDRIEQAAAIAEGTLDLDAALRAAELARLTTDLAAAEQQLRDAPAVTLDAELLAQIAAANRIIAGDVTIPIPRGARAEPESTQFKANAEGTIELTVIAPHTVAQLHALYTCWARSEGWLIEVDDDDQTAGGLRVAKGSRRVGIVLAPWGKAETMMLLHLHRTPEATYQATPAPAAPAAPALTAVARRYPTATLDAGQPLSVDAMACDRGLLFVTDHERVRMIDPTTRTIRVVAGDGDVHEDARLSNAQGLVCDGDGLWVADRSQNAIRRVDFAKETVSTLTRELPWPVHLALAGTTLYATCDRGQLYAVDTRTGTTQQLLGENVLAQHRYDWAVEGLAVIGDTLYAVEGSGSVHAFDRATGAVRKVTEVPSKPRGMTTDGHALYVGCWGGIVQIRLGERVVVEQIAGKPDFRTGDADGPADVSAIETATHLAWDGTAGLYFIDDRRRLRWLHVERRFVVTVM